MELLDLSIEPTVEPVIRADVKTALRLTHAADDTYIDAIIMQARKLCELFLRRALTTQTWKYTLDVAPRRIILPWPPAQNIITIKVTDNDGVQTTVDATLYNTIFPDDASVTVIWLPTGNSWPSFRDQLGFEIKYKAGYGDAASDVPDIIKRGIIALAVYLFDHRGDSIDVNLLQANAFKMLAALRVFHVGYS